jgi:hypothetical protein
MDTASFRKWLTRSEAMADPHAHHFEKDRSFWGSPMVFCLLGGEFFPGTTTAFGQNPAVRQIEPARNECVPAVRRLVVPDRRRRLNASTGSHGFSAGYPGSRDHGGIPGAYLRRCLAPTKDAPAPQLLGEKTNV